MAEQADFIKADAEMAWRDWMRKKQAGRPGFAEGGTVLATKPTTVQFGEGKEPEMATAPDNTTDEEIRIEDIPF